MKIKHKTEAVVSKAAASVLFCSMKTEKQKRRCNTMKRLMAMLLAAAMPVP